MKRAITSLFAVALACQLAACVNTEKEMGTSSADPRATYSPPNPSDRARLTSSTVLNTVQTSHAFSDPSSPDHFVLQLRGTRVLSARAHLIVTSSSGDTLRHEVLPARALLNPNSPEAQSASVRDQEFAILRSMNTFFAADHFSQPAVPAASEQPAELDGAMWQSLRDDPTAVAFDYNGADGGERRLAYSHKLHKTVVMNQ